MVLTACDPATTPTSPDFAQPAQAEVLASNTWAPRAPIPSPRTQSVASAGPNAAGQWIAHIFGGMDEFGTGLSGFSYNVATDTWTGNGALVHAANLNGTARIGRRIYFTGGESCCDVDFRTFSTTWAYDVPTKRLLQKADAPRPTKYGVSGSIGGKVYVLPGWCSGESVDPNHCATGRQFRQLWRYDPSTNTWSTLRQAPHFHGFGGAAVIGDKFYVVGGWNHGAFLDVYDPATNTWRTLAPIPTPGDRLFAPPIQSKLFVLSWSQPSGSPVISSRPTCTILPPMPGKNERHRLAASPGPSFT